jgi:mannitol-1-/sugar-/sorbitol-6-phosphatase
MSDGTKVFECDALLLDLDGVLVDSAASIVRQWLRWAAHHGLSPDLVRAEAQGSRTEDTIRRLVPHLDAAGEARAMEIAQIGDVHDVTACAGASKIVAALPDDRWAIVTSGTRALALSRLRTAELPLPRILVCGDDVRRGKPAPDGYLHAASELGADPSACLVIEDSALGVAAAQAAGMRVIAVSTAGTQASVRPEPPPDATVTSLLQIQPTARISDLRITISPAPSQ